MTRPLLLREVSQSNSSCLRNTLEGPLGCTQEWGKSGKKTKVGRKRGQNGGVKHKGTMDQNEENGSGQS